MPFDCGAIFSAYLRHIDFFRLRPAKSDECAADKIGVRIAERASICKAYPRTRNKADILQPTAHCSVKLQTVHAGSRMILHF